MRRLTDAASRTSTLEGMISPGSPAAGRPIGELGLPRGAVVVSTVRRGSLLSPTPRQTLEPGDTVTVLARRADLESIRRLLELAPRPDNTGEMPAVVRGPPDET
jgi:trk system potassium uptake protein